MTGKLKNDIKTEMKTDLSGNLDGMKRINEYVSEKLSPTVKALEENNRHNSSLLRDLLKAFNSLHCDIRSFEVFIQHPQNLKTEFLIPVF